MSVIPGVGGGLKSKQSVLSSRRFSICEFAYLLKFIFNPPINTQNAFVVILRLAQVVKNSSHLTHTFLAEVEQGDPLPPHFSSHPADKGLFVDYSAPCFSHFCAFSP